MAKTIYTDQETDKIIQELKEKDPEFNLSSFVKVKLREGFGTETTLLELSNQLEEAKIEEDKAKARQQYLRQKIAEIQVKNANEKQRMQFEEQKKQTREEERYKTFKNIAPEVAPQLTVKEIDQFAHEFALEDIDIRSFLDSKEVFGKEEENAPEQQTS